MSRYASQLIIDFMIGEGDDDIRRGSRTIIYKGLANGVTGRVFQGDINNPAPVAAAIQSLPRPWRLYLGGEGSFAGQHLGGHWAEEMAEYLSGCGLETNLPETISVIACYLALGRGLSKDRLFHTAPDNSFVGDLHYILGDKYQIFTSMQGRPMACSLRVDGPERGTKYTNAPGTSDFLHKQPYSKIIFFWHAGRQCSKFAYNEPEHQ